MKKKQLYYTVDNILKHGADYNIIYGERSNGKSYAVKKHCMSKAYKKRKATFVYMRRNELEVKANAVEQYFMDTPVQDITDGEFNCISVWQGKIYLSNMDTETFKITRGFVIGYIMYLSGAVHFKSRAYPDVEDMIFEEFLYKGDYLPDETDTLLDIVSTVFRRRKGCVWCIGNTVNRLNPYYRNFGLHNMPHQKPFSIDDYTFDIGGLDENGNKAQVKIAVEYCGSNADTPKSAMVFGSHEKTINGGSWECGEHPRLPKMEFDVVYEILIFWYGLGYVCQYIIFENGNTCLYVYPYTGHRKIDRVIQDDFSNDPNVTKKLFRDSEIEQDMVEMFRQNKMCFSDNLTGDEFINMFRYAM